MSNEVPVMYGQQPGAAIWLKNSQGKVFFQMRDSGPAVAPLQFALWGGAIDPGEKPDEAGTREMMEELTLKQWEYPFVEHHEMRIRNEHGEHFYTYLFVVGRPVSWGDFTILEGAGGAFFTLEEALRVDLAPMARAWVNYMLQQG